MMKKKATIKIEALAIIALGVSALLYNYYNNKSTEINEVQWEYMPLLSSRYPAMPFTFDVSCQEIIATCNNGTLIDFDHFDGSSESYSQGKSLMIQNAGKIY